MSREEYGEYGFQCYRAQGSDKINIFFKYFISKTSYSSELFLIECCTFVEQTAPC